MTSSARDVLSRVDSFSGNGVNPEKTRDGGSVEYGSLSFRPVNCRVKKPDLTWVRPGFLEENLQHFTV